MPAQARSEVRGIYKTTSSILPFKFQELELVDPDLENAPVVAEMGTMELRAFRSRMLGSTEYIPSNQELHRGRISELSKKAGWHHVSTADEEPMNVPRNSIIADYLDPPNAPFVSIKIFYRPRELLRAQGIITGPNVSDQGGQGSGINGKKRPREDGSSATPGPSKRPTVKEEENDTRAQRIRALQAELSSLKAEQPGSSIKRELRSPSPIVVGAAAGEVIDLTLED
ncbi:hypothetical protein BJV78DRAFT_1184302 [Lactifluus subvellereus]|nr:hypothetical protein BJV78DRAFT_1184302 [Lactifluus subvellereus]